MGSASDIERRVMRALSLPPLRGVVVRLLSLTSDDGASIQDIGDCLSQDPALVQKVLQTVNSPLYGVGKQVTTVNQAVSLLGVNSLRALAVGLMLLRSVAHRSQDEVGVSAFWTEALTNAVTARLLASQVGYPSREEAFVGGLLQNVGALALCHHAPSDYGALRVRLDECVKKNYRRDKAMTIGNRMADLEQEVLGTDHARIGGALCRAWGLPDAIARPVGFHHKPDVVAPKPQSVADLAHILNLADLAGQIFAAPGKAAFLEALEQAGLAYFGLRRSCLDDILRQAASLVTEAARTFEVHIGDTFRYEDILAEAEREVAERMAAAERRQQQQARDPVAVIRRDVQAESLDAERADPANRDALTGLFSRSYLERFLTQEARKRRGTREPMPLIIVEVRGPEQMASAAEAFQADVMRVQFACCLRSETRDADVVAHCGRHRFAVVPMAASPRIVQRIAVRLRNAMTKQLASSPLAASEKTALHVGVVYLGADERPGGPAEILEAAQSALEAGRQEGDTDICLVHA